MDVLLAEIIKSVANFRGADFFAALVLKLNNVIAADLTFIASIDNIHHSYNTLALAEHGNLTDNVEFSLSDTPFEQLSHNSTSIYFNNVAKTFPEDKFLSEKKAEGYLGLPLYGANGDILAILVAIYQKPLTEQQNTLTMLQTFSGRIIAEIESMKRENQLIDLNNSLLVQNEVLDERARLNSVEDDRLLNQLQQAVQSRIEMNKMAALGGMIAGIAHEVNGPLGVAITAESHLAEIFSDFSNKVNGKGLTIKTMMHFIEQQKETLPMIAHNLQRAKHLLEDFKQTATEQSIIEVQRISLNEYYQRVISTLTPLIKRKKAVIDLTGCEDDSVTTLPGCHAQLLMNLVKYSIEHGFIADGDHKISINIHRDTANYIIDYCDNGIGLTQSKQDEILSTKKTSITEINNIDLGLVICNSLVVDELGGKCSFLACEQGIHFQYQFKTIAESAKG